jgi:hypothetical protein
MSQGAGAKPRDRAQDETGPADAARYSRPAALPGVEAFVIPPHAVHTGEAASPDGSVTGSSTSTQSQGRRPSQIAW